MNTMTRAISALGLAAALAGGGRLYAHDMDKMDAKDMAKPGAEGKDHGMMGGMMKGLDLSKDQAAKMKALHKDQHEAMEKAEDKLKLDIDQLRLLVDKKAGDVDLIAAISAVKADHEAFTDLQKKHHDAMQAILTPMQQAKMVIGMADHMKGMLHGGMMGGDMMQGKDKDDDDDKDAAKEHDHAHEKSGSGY